MYRKILIVVDDHPSAQAAIRHGVELADAHGSDVYFYYLLPNYIYPISEMAAVAAISPAEFERASKAVASTVLKDATRLAEGAAVVSVSVMGSPSSDDAASVVTAVVKRHCDLIIVASEGQNAVMRMLTGSIIPRLITLSPVPVIVCPTRNPQSDRKRGTTAPNLMRRRRAAAKSRDGD